MKGALWISHTHTHKTCEIYLHFFLLSVTTVWVATVAAWIISFSSTLGLTIIWTCCLLFDQFSGKCLMIFCIEERVMCTEMKYKVTTLPEQTCDFISVIATVNLDHRFGIRYNKHQMSYKAEILFHSPLCILISFRALSILFVSKTTFNKCWR